MKVIQREDLVKLGGAEDARYCVFYPSGDLYLCTTAPCGDVLNEAYWAERGYSMREVVG
jgi:hypothetical protein